MLEEHRCSGYEIASQSRQVRARVGYVSETNSLYDFLTIPQLCAFCRSFSAGSGMSMWWTVYVGMFGLPRVEKVGNLSKGMKSPLSIGSGVGK